MKKLNLLWLIILVSCSPPEEKKSNDNDTASIVHDKVDDFLGYDTSLFEQDSQGFAASYISGKHAQYLFNNNIITDSLLIKPKIIRKDTVFPFYVFLLKNTSETDKYIHVYEDSSLHYQTLETYTTYDPYTKKGGWTYGSNGWNLRKIIPFLLKKDSIFIDPVYYEQIDPIIDSLMFGFLASESRDDKYEEIIKRVKVPKE